MSQILLKLWLIGNRTSCRPIRSVIILVIKQIGLPLRGRPILLITRMITDLKNRATSFLQAPRVHEEMITWYLFFFAPFVAVAVGVRRRTIFFYLFWRVFDLKKLLLFRRPRPTRKCKYFSHIFSLFLNLLTHGSIYLSKELLTRF